MPTRLLFFGSDNTSVESHQKLLRDWGYDLLVVVDPQTLANALHLPDVPRQVVIDATNPLTDTPRLISQVRAAAIGDRAHILVIVSQGSLRAAMEAGADDVIVRPFTVESLSLRLRSATRIVKLQDENMEIRRSFQKHALHDFLTGVLNRGAILDLLTREIERSRRSDMAVTVLMADLDYFKQINDTLGHPTGDAAIIAASNRISSQLRIYDGVGRYGGDEFLIVLSGCGESQARVIAERIRHAVADTPIDTPTGPLSMTLSMGLVASKPAVFLADAASLVRLADAALYQAKRAGRNLVISSQLVDDPRP